MNNNLDYKFAPISIDGEYFLNFLKNISSDDSVLGFIEKELNPNRINFDGIITCIANCKDIKVGIAYCDFKVFGGSFGVKNSKRLCAFIEYLNIHKIPLFFGINSIGVRIFEGRKVFAESFRVIPTLLNYRKSNFLFTANLDKALGISAILLSLGDYVVSVGGESSTNLTGPEVFKLFFGAKVDFNKESSSLKWINNNNLIQHIVDKKEDALEIFKDIISVSSYKGYSTTLDTNPHLKSNLNSETQRIINTISYLNVELFNQLKGAVKCIVAKTLNGPIGVLINPIGEGNLIDTITVKKYQLGINLFKKLNLPLISMVDTSGFDPRVEELSKNLLAEIVQLTEDVIAYPHYKFGIILQRCFGGASTLSIPTFLGGDKAILIRGAKLGIMSEKIIESLLSGSPRLLGIWKDNKNEEDDINYTDILDSGLVGDIVSLEELPVVINLRLLHLSRKNINLEIIQRSLSYTNSIIATI